MPPKSTLLLAYSGLLLITSVLADIQFSHIQPITGFTPSCTIAYDSPVAGCEIADFFPPTHEPVPDVKDNNNCTSACRSSLLMMQSYIRRGCGDDSVKYGNVSLIGRFILTGGPDWLCGAKSGVAMVDLPLQAAVAPVLNSGGPPSQSVTATIPNGPLPPVSLSTTDAASTTTASTTETTSQSLTITPASPSVSTVTNTNIVDTTMLHSHSHESPWTTLSSAPDQSAPSTSESAVTPSSPAEVQATSSSIDTTYWPTPPNVPTDIPTQYLTWSNFPPTASPTSITDAPTLSSQSATVVSPASTNSSWSQTGLPVPPSSAAPSSTALSSAAPSSVAPSSAAPSMVLPPSGAPTLLNTTALPVPTVSMANSTLTSITTTSLQSSSSHMHSTTTTKAVSTTTASASATSSGAADGFADRSGVLGMVLGLAAVVGIAA